MLKVNSLITPLTLFTNLQGDGSVSKENLPTIKQVQSFKARALKSANGQDDEMQRVDKFIAENQYKPDIDPNKVFVFASRNGTGSDESPFTVCITALNWLTWVQK